VVWLDGLDIPMVRFFDAGFMENGPSPWRECGHWPRVNFSYPYAKAMTWLEG
jgi:gentisate 1,2-dioxygenase